MSHPQDGNPASTTSEDLGVEILRLTDELIGAAAETARAREDATHAWSVVADRDRELADTRVTAAAELAALRADYERSRRFRIGKAVLAPVDAVKRRTTGRTMP